MKYQKSQVSVFIIVALLVVLGGVLSYFMFYYDADKTGEVGTQTVTDYTETERIFYEYVQECLDKQLYEAVTKAGEQGGYISMDGSYGSRTLNINRMQPTESEAFPLTPDGNLLLPYWYYMDRPDDCVQCEMKSQMPSLYLIRNQIEEYVSEKMMICLDDFDPFREMGYAVYFDKELDPEVTFGEEDVSIRISMPFSVEKEDTQKMDFELFEARMDVPFIKYYTIAHTIYSLEYNTLAFEKLILNLIGLYSGIDFTLLPPISGVDHKAYAVTWDKYSVEQNIEDMLTTMISYVKLKNTRNEQLMTSDDELVQGVYNTLLWDVFVEDFDVSDYDINFYYLGWDTYFDITPNDGGMISPRTTIREYPFDIKSATHTNRYDFFYDLSVPIMVEIKNPDANHKDGFTFMFGMEANIRDNKNMFEWNQGKGTFGPADYSKSEFSYDDVTSNGSVVKFSVNDTNSKTLFTDSKQKVSANVTLNIYDAFTGLPIEDRTAIYYGCGDHALAFIDSVEYDDNIMISRYHGRFPVCLGGYIQAISDGYHPFTKPFDAEFTKERSLNIMLYPKKEFSVDVEMYEASETSALSRGIGIKNSEKAFINIERLPDPDNPFESQFFQTVLLGGTEPTQKINLVPGKYKVFGRVVDSLGYTIPANCKEYCVEYETGIFSGGDCESYDTLPKDEIKLVPAIKGGVEINESYPFEISASDLKSSNELTFRLIRVRDSTCVDEANGNDESCLVGQCIGINETNRWIGLSQENHMYLKPVFS